MSQAVAQLLVVHPKKKIKKKKKKRKIKKEKSVSIRKMGMNKGCGELNEYPTNVVQSLSSNEQIISKVLNKEPYQ